MHAVLESAGRRMKDDSELIICWATSSASGPSDLQVYIARMVDTEVLYRTQAGATPAEPVFRIIQYSATANAVTTISSIAGPLLARSSQISIVPIFLTPQTLMEILATGKLSSVKQVRSKVLKWP